MVCFEGIRELGVGVRWVIGGRGFWLLSWIFEGVGRGKRGEGGRASAIAVYNF